MILKSSKIDHFANAMVKQNGLFWIKFQSAKIKPKMTL